MGGWVGRNKGEGDGCMGPFFFFLLPCLIYQYVQCFAGGMGMGNCLWDRHGRMLLEGKREAGGGAVKV